MIHGWVGKGRRRGDRAEGRIEGQEKKKGDEKKRKNRKKI
jgi:hypothetical protein